MKQEAWGVADLTRSRCRPWHRELATVVERDKERMKKKKKIKIAKWAPHVSSWSHFLCLRQNIKRIDPIPPQLKRK
jgi:hypothetical protein